MITEISMSQIQRRTGMHLEIHKLEAGPMNTSEFLSSAQQTVRIKNHLHLGMSLPNQQLF